MSRQNFPYTNDEAGYWNSWDRCMNAINQVTFSRTKEDVEVQNQLNLEPDLIEDRWAGVLIIFKPIHAQVVFPFLPRVENDQVHNNELSRARTLVSCRFLVGLVSKKGGRLEIPGGCVKPGETPFQAAKREVAEEAGWNADLQSATTGVRGDNHWLQINHKPKSYFAFMTSYNIGGGKLCRAHHYTYITNDENEFERFRLSQPDCQALFTESNGIIQIPALWEPQTSDELEECATIWGQRLGNTGSTSYKDSGIITLMKQHGMLDLGRGHYQLLMQLCEAGVLTLKQVLHLWVYVHPAWPRWDISNVFLNGLVETLNRWAGGLGIGQRITVQDIPRRIEIDLRRNVIKEKLQLDRKTIN